MIATAARRTVRAWPLWIAVGVLAIVAITFALIARGVLHENWGEVDEFMKLVGLEGFADAFPHHRQG